MSKLASPTWLKAPGRPGYLLSEHEDLEHPDSLGFHLGPERGELSAGDRQARPLPAEGTQLNRNSALSLPGAGGGTLINSERAQRQPGAGRLVLALGVRQTTQMRNRGEAPRARSPPGEL